MDIDSLTNFLSRHGYASARNLQPLGAGMFSQAYQFETDAALFVVRIGVTRETFEKDKLAHERLGQVVPIPKVWGIGRYNESRFYCISEWKLGRTLTVLSSEETQRLLPSLFENLLSMSQIQVPSDTKFGILNGQGNARRLYKTWAEFIAAIDDFSLTFTPRGDEIYEPWNTLIETTFLDKSVVQDARQRLFNLLPVLPNERHYVHGDFGYDNALTNGHQLSAILDWAELRCGDWLYDLAYLAYYDVQNVNYIEAFRQWVQSNRLDIPNLTDRIQASYLHIFLGNIFLEANRNQRDWYDEDILRYQQLMA